MTLSANDCFSWCLQKNANGLSFATPGAFEATGAGAADGTTIVSTSLASYASGNDDFVGMWIEVVAASNSSGVEQGAPIARRIVEYTHATQTFGVQALGFQTADGDTYRLYDPPNYYLAEDTGGSASIIADASRTEADDALNGTEAAGGYYVEVIKADNISTSQHSRAINWTNATADLTCEALGANTAIGDLFDLLKHPEVSGLIGGNQPRIDRSPVTGTLGVPQSVAGLREGSGQHTVPFQGPGTAGSGTPTAIDDPLRCVFSADSMTDVVADAAATTTSIPRKAGGTPAAGKIYCTEAGDVFVVSSYSAPDMVPSPTLRTAPAEDTNLYGGRRYRPLDNAGPPNYAMYLQQWRGKEILEHYWGCIPTVALTMQRGNRREFALNWQAADFIRVFKDDTDAALSRAWRALLPSIVARQLGNCRVNIGGTEIKAHKVDIDMGLDIQPHTNLAAPNQTDGFYVAGCRPTINVSAFIDADTKDEMRDFFAGVPKTVLVQSGQGYSDPGIVALWCYEMEYTGAEPGDESGISSVQLQMREIENRTQTALPRFVLATF